MAERTGCPIFLSLWSYVKEMYSIWTHIATLSLRKIRRATDVRLPIIKTLRLWTQTIIPVSRSEAGHKLLYSAHETDYFYQWLGEVSSPGVKCHRLNIKTTDTGTQHTPTIVFIWQSFTSQCIIVAVILWDQELHYICELEEALVILNISCIYSQHSLSI